MKLTIRELAYIRDQFRKNYPDFLSHFKNTSFTAFVELSVERSISVFKEFYHIKYDENLNIREEIVKTEWPDSFADWCYRVVSDAYKIKVLLNNTR